MEFMEDWYDDDLSPWMEHEKSQVAASCQTGVLLAKEPKKIAKRIIYPV